MPGAPTMLDAPGRWHIHKSSVDGVWYSGATYDVVDPAGAVKATFGYLGLFGARVWGLLHLKWLPVEGE